MAGVSIKEIKNRIRSMRSTRQITKAMEMVAASKLRRSQEQVISARPYFEILHATIHEIVEANRELSSPYLSKRQGNRMLYVVIAGDRGLAGGYNSNVCRPVMTETVKKEVTVVPIGRKAVDFFKPKGVPILTLDYAQAEHVSVGDCFTLAKDLCQRYLDGQYDGIWIAYTQFVSVLSQIPNTMPMLPLLRHETAGEGAAHCVTLYEPSGAEVFDRIVPEYLGGILYGALCESRAAEQAARRAAMDSATQNADTMIADLSLTFNRARQAAITQEITEIVAGSQ